MVSWKKFIEQLYIVYKNMSDFLFHLWFVIIFVINQLVFLNINRNGKCNVNVINILEQ